MSHAGKAKAAVVLGAIGVVFGDIGTSPLYTLRTVFAPEHGLEPSREAVFGVVSLIFWAITVIVSIKYVTFIMRADNDGEGGIMALIALIQQANLRSRGAQITLVLLGVFGASLFYGDGMITPAISVLSAVEGLEVVSPDLEEFVIPITLIVLSVLFAAQRFGTGAVGGFFGPIMVVWFGVLALSGLIRALGEPEIFGALSPHHGAEFLFNHGHEAFVALGGVVLAVTGAEALYADMGHFGASAIRRAWFTLVFGALILNYLGQGALILSDPSASSSPFFLLFPDWARIPMVILSTVAAIIASQAVISGAFSVTRQAIRLGFLPRLVVRHTSRKEIGQVYVPAVNWIIFAAVVALVVGFGSSERLASAYGIAVTGTLAIDTLLFAFVVRALWHRPMWLVVVGCGAFLIVDLTFFAANVTKILHGGWFPLAIAVVVFGVLTTWQRGREIVTTRRVREEGPLRDFVEEVRNADPPVSRAPGHRGLPQRQPAHDAAGAARQRRAQPRAARVRPDRLDDDRARALRARVRAALDRRPRLRRRRHHPHHRPLRLPGPAERARAAAPGRQARRRRRRAARQPVLLRLADHDHRHPPPGHGALAQAPVPGHLTQRRQPCRGLPPARRAHGRHGVAYRTLT